MSLKAIVESLDGIDHKDFYKQLEINGKPVYVLDVESVNGYALEDVRGLKSSLENVKAERESLKSAAQSFKGLDAKEVREKLAKFDQLAKSGSTDAEKIAEARVQQLNQQWEQRYSELESDKNTYRSVVDETLRKQVAIQAIAVAKGNTDLLLPHVLNQTRTREVEKGRFVVEVINADGVARIKDANTNMSIEDLVGEMRNSSTFGVAFQGTDKSGSGTSGGPGNPKGLWDDNASDKDRLAFLQNKANSI
jgi:hypothetical protein